MRDTEANRIIVTRQAMRLSVFGYFDEAAIREIATALLGAFNDLSAVRAAVDEFVCWDHRPVPGEIWHYARQAKGETRSRWCSICDGTGWRIVTRKAHDPCAPAGTAPHEIEEAARCQCRAAMGGGQ